MRTKALENHHSSSFWMSTQVKPFHLKFYLGAGVCLVLWLLTSFGRAIKSPIRKLALPTLGLLLAMVGLSSFSQTAYAASYINVSSGSGGTVSLGSIRPSSSGTSSTGSDTLTIHTDCSTGYSVYVSGQKDKDTNLTNSSASSNNTIATSSTAVGSTATTLNTNTWGLNSENTGTYVGLPTYANATNKALTSKSSVSESSTVPIYYGVKVDTSLTPGTYTGNVLYTVMMDSSCLAYTVVFNSNGGTGTMNSQSIMTGTATALSANTFTRSGYAFLGWSTKATGKTGTASNGIGTSADVDYTDKAEVTNLTSSGNSITLYAIWQKVDGTMQSWTGCSALSVSDSVSLLDTRDNKVYAVKKLPDGKCWMMQNLTINGVTLTPDDTNIDNGTTYYLPKDGGKGSITDSATTSSTSGYNFNTTYSNQASFKIRSKDSSITNDGDTGYYNFYTATLGFSYYNDDKTSGSSTRDICPKGWRLPKTTDSGNNVTTVGSANDFTYLALQYNSSTGWNGSATGTSAYDYYNNNDVVMNPMYKSTASPLAASTQNNYAGFSYSGYWNSTNASASSVGSHGYYWSSSVYGTDRIYNLRLSSGIYPQNNERKYFGFAVRCLAKYDYLIDYSSDDADSGSPSKTSDGAVLTSDSVTMPTVGTMVKSGYEFKGWALASGSTAAAYTAEESVSLSTLLSAANSSGQTTTPGSTLTLYPVWEETVTYMQNWSGCAALSTGESATLRDSRDSKDYAVKKLPDGKCWMMQNLTINGVALTPDDTNIDNGTTYYLPKDGGRGSITDPSTINSTSGYNFNYSNSSQASFKFRTKDSSVTNDSDTGYYNFYTATLGYSYEISSGSGDGISQGSSTRDICPKGWRLPKVTDNGSSVSSGSPAEFTALVNSYLSTPISGTGNISTSDATVKNSMYLEAASPLATSTKNNYAGFAYSGSWSGTNTSAYSVGSGGTYQSSSVRSADGGYDMYFSSSSISPQNSNSKSSGFAVRCVAKDTRTISDITYMQDINSDIVANTATNAYAQLTDSRDNNKYYVKKLADGKLWMVQNLRLVGSHTLTSSDSDVSSDFTITTSTANPDTTNWCKSVDATCYNKSQVYYNSSEASGSSKSSYYGALYNWYTATAGTGTYSTSGNTVVPSSICPKGWHLPKGGTDETANEFSVLDIAWGGTGKTRSGANTYDIFTGNYTGDKNGGFGLAGYIVGSVIYVGSYGSYWSSTASGSYEAYYLYLDKRYATVSPQYNGYRYIGYSVRCVASS